MTLNRLMLACVSLCLAATSMTARAADCWVQRAVRDGTGVKVVLFKPKGNPPGVAVPMTIIRADGVRTFINQSLFISTNPVKITTVNPRMYVILHVGDELGYAGMDDGCTVRVMRVSGKLELKIKGGLPPLPGSSGVNRGYEYLMPVQSEK